MTGDAGGGADAGQWTRRGFLELTGGTLAAVGLSGGTLAEVGGDESDDPAHHGLLLGPEAQRPPADGDYLGDWDEYRFVYFATDTGAKSYISTDDSDWTDLPMPNPQTQVEELRVEDHTSFFNHTFARPSAPDDKNWLYTSADVTKQSSEVELAASTSMTSTQRGNYPPGTEAIPGVAWRVTGTPTGGSAEAGYFDSTNGFGVGEDSTGSYAFVRKAGTTHTVYRTDQGNGGWNGHVPDGRVWDSDSPVITRFPHLFYGGGSINVRALLHDGDTPELRTLHTFTPENVPSSFGAGPPFDQPNLPITFDSASLAGGNLRANAAHYEYGDEHDESRLNGEHFDGITVTASGWTPILSFAKRSGWEMVNIKPSAFDVFAATNDVKLSLQLDPTLGSAPSSLPANTASDESAVHVKTGGTINTTGQRRWTGFVQAGGNNKFGSAESNKIDFNLPADQTVTLAGQAIGGDATVKGHGNWEEFF